MSRLPEGSDASFCFIKDDVLTHSCQQNLGCVEEAASPRRVGCRDANTEEARISRRNLLGV